MDKSGRSNFARCVSHSQSDGLIRHWMIMAMFSSFSGLRSITCRMTIAILSFVERWGF